MAVYSMVNVGYDVLVFKSLDTLCDEIRGRVYDDGDLFIDRNCSVKATINQVKSQFRDFKKLSINLYRNPNDGWAYKVDKHV